MVKLFTPASLLLAVRPRAISPPTNADSARLRPAVKRTSTSALGQRVISQQRSCDLKHQSALADGMDEANLKAKLTTLSQPAQQLLIR
jgi:hypothetical protein